MITGIIDILIWWLLISIIGYLAWPLARRFFQSYPDRGFLLSKGLGLTLVCFLNWMICSLHLIPFSVVSVLVSILIMATLSWFLRTDQISDLKEFLLKEKNLVLTGELMFLGGFLFFGLIRMCNPDIAQTEKMPDLAFLTGILNSGYFPPKEPWFVGETINYFYYGHYQIAMLTKLSGLAPEYTYNLGIAFLFAITLLMATGITYGLTRRKGYGILGGLLVAFLGNLEGITQLLGNLKHFIDGSKNFYPFNWFNWWMSSRVIVREGIDITINEFPFWSYILGGLHAHVNVVPFSLLVLAIVLELFRTSGDGLNSLGRGKDLYFRWTIAAVAIGAIPAANTWDTPTYFALLIAALILGRQFAIRTYAKTSMLADDTELTFYKILMTPLKEIIYLIKPPKPSDPDAPESKLSWNRLVWSWVAVVMILVLAWILYSPFHLNFAPKGTQGVKVVNAIQRTLAGDFLSIYGFFVYSFGAFVVLLAAPIFTEVPKRLKALYYGSFAGGFLFIYMIFDRLMIALCLILLYLIFRVKIDLKQKNSQDTFFALALFTTVIIILLGCEFFYLKDAYGKSLERQNTIFKFYYQAWILCGISTAYAVFWIREKGNRFFSNIWEPGFRLLLLCTLAFPFFGTFVKCNHFAAFTKQNTYSNATMEGIWYMSWQYKGDYEAIQYLNEHATPDEIVLEATGPAFSHYGRISAATGLSTVLGWANHENIWRDGSWNVVTQRSNEVKNMYTSTDINAIKALLDKYKINYVYVGKLEYEQYPDADFDKFKTFMKTLLEVKESDGKMSYLYHYR